jgi:hypothetical protein
VFWLSTATNSAARDSIASAILRSARWRSDGVVSRHDSNAVAAALIATSTSTGPETGALANGAPIVGSITSAYEPSFVSTYAPSTKFRSLRESLMSHSCTSTCVWLVDLGVRKPVPLAILATDSVADKGRADRFRLQPPS